MLSYESTSLLLTLLWLIKTAGYKKKPGLSKTLGASEEPSLFGDWLAVYRTLHSSEALTGFKSVS